VYIHFNYLYYIKNMLLIQREVNIYNNYKKKKKNYHETWSLHQILHQCSIYFLMFAVKKIDWLCTFFFLLKNRIKIAQKKGIIIGFVLFLKFLQISDFKFFLFFLLNTFFRLHLKKRNKIIIFSNVFFLVEILNFTTYTTI
jgi:hypothetical protein